jgi:pentachlorophenol monooxygenase/3-(3-hydroxy-phenyl)propionate hydroxylase
VDSGRFAEPFWYIDSPLTTTDPARPFAGRPPRGQTPAPGPGILVPDMPVSAPGATRLRELVRDGLLVLTTEGVDPAAIAAAVKETTAAPHRAVSLADLRVDAAVLGAHAGEAWLVRPDGHVAAVLTDPSPRSVGAAVRRVLALKGC